jgi:penicillin-binding protein 1C
MRITGTDVLRFRHERRKNHNAWKVLLGFSSSTLLAVALALVMLVLLSGIGALSVYQSYASELPDPAALEAHFTQTTNTEFFETTRIYDRTGATLLYEIIDPRGGDRLWVPLDQISPYVISATVAVEDRSFFENQGVNPRGLLRAFVANLTGEQVQGGSSITQQVIKNTLIPAEERAQVSYERKFKEVLLALEVTRRYSKAQILEWYLNTNHYGNLAYGIEAASQVYFGKHASELTLAEAAMLAHIPQFPAMNPINAPDEATERQHIVLDAMLLEGYISAEDAILAKYTTLRYEGVQQRFSEERIKAPHFSIYVRQELEKMFGPDVVYGGGLKVYTTLDLNLQNKAEEIARTHVKALQDEQKNVNNACVVALRPATGEILVMVGSLDYWNTAEQNGFLVQGAYNVCTGVRQPGSSFKPITYVTAFAQGYTAASMVLDVPTTFTLPGRAPYSPENYDHRFHGPQSLRQALARSYNIPAVQVMAWAGVDSTIRMAHRLGITTLDEGPDYFGLALTLGGGEVKPLDMAVAFGVFANNGVMAGMPIPDERQRLGFRELDPVAILRVEDRNGQVLWEYKQPEQRPVLDPELAYLISDVLSDNNSRAAAFGANSPLALSRPAAAKTGTTNDFRDNWTVGYTPQLVTAVWVGNNDNSEMQNVSGIAGAAPIWHDFMEYAHTDKPVETWSPPPGVQQATVCAPSGLLPTRFCQSRVAEWFVRGTEPKKSDDIYQAFLVNKANGKLATIYTPPELVEERVFMLLPPQANDWLAGMSEEDRARWPLPPTQTDDENGPKPSDADTALISPATGAFIQGVVPIIGNAKGDGFNLYKLEFGRGYNPAQWTPIGGEHGEQVDHAQLETWDVSGLDGLYTLQLTVIRNDNPEQVRVPVTVDNAAPSITVVYPVEGLLYDYAQTQWVSIEAEASDNYALERVEFYVDGSLVAVRTIAPFSARWTISSGGTHRIWVVAVDAAGNRTESQRVSIAVQR